MLLKRNDIMFVLVSAMIISLFISRAALSITMAGFFLAAISLFNLKITVKKFLTTPLLWSIALLFLIPLISGVWSADKSAWLDIMRTKLPLLLLPFAFAANFVLTSHQWRAIAAILLILVFAGSLWTISVYLQETKQFEETYLRSSTLPTPLENDHVRFSWLAGFCVLVSAWISIRQSNMFFRVAAGAIGLWLIVFLHILAARTGLVVLYILVLAFTIILIRNKTKPVFGMASIICLIALPVIAYSILPTFRNRVKFVSYDFGYFKDAHYLPGGSDAVRVISFKAGIHSIVAQPFLGYGFGDIESTINDYYEKNYAEVKEEDRIKPSSQLLIYGVGCGLAGMLALLWVMLIPFLMKIEKRFIWCIINFIIAIPLLYDVGLEIQYGVFIYTAILLLVWKSFTSVGQKI